MVKLCSAKKKENGIDECCCTCLYNNRVVNDHIVREGSNISCICEKDNHYITYIQSYECKCRAYKLDTRRYREGE